MNITIGITGVARELRTDVDMDEAALTSAFTQAVEGDTVLNLKTVKGDTLVIPARKIGFLMISDERPRQVGFTVS